MKSAPQVFLLETVHANPGVVMALKIGVVDPLNQHVSLPVPVGYS